jgi:hypothetical protein
VMGAFDYATTRIEYPRRRIVRSRSSVRDQIRSIVAAKKARPDQSDAWLS